MKIETYPRGKYRIIRIFNEQKVISDLTELSALVQGYIANGTKHVAISFSCASYLFSDPISVLVNCYKKIKDVQGTLCLIEPQEELLDLLRQLNLDSLVDIYNSEDELPAT